MDLSTGGIRTGVVGLGYFGSFHARHHAANARSRLVGVVDADSARADAAAAAHGAEAFCDHRELIGRWMRCRSPYLPRCTMTSPAIFSMPAFMS